MELNHLPAAPLNNGYRVTAGNGEQDPNCVVETTGVEPVVPFGRRIYSPLGLPIFLHLHTILKHTKWNHCVRLFRRLRTYAVHGHYCLTTRHVRLHSLTLSFIRFMSG